MDSPQKLPKVLILCHDYKPLNSVGAKRPESWFRYFKAMGLYPVVVTKSWNSDVNEKHANYIEPSVEKDIQVVVSEHGTEYFVPFKPNLRDRLVLKFGMNRWKLTRKALTMAQQFLGFWLITIDSRCSIYKAAVEIVKKEQFDLIIATGEPFIMHWYARLLSKQAGIPYVVDYRDGWSENNTKKGKGKLADLVLWYENLIERKTIASAAAITYSNPHLARDCKELFGNKQAKLIRNGFDEELLEKVNKEAISGTCEDFVIGYSGTLYPAQRLDIFYEGVSIFLEQNPAAKVKIMFIGGSYYPEQHSRILNCPDILKDKIICTQRYPQAEALTKLRQSQILLVLADQPSIVLPVKLYEYLALDRYVLVVKNDYGDVEEIVNHTHSGSLKNTGEEVAALLGWAYKEWLEQGHLASTTQFASHYGRKAQALEMTIFLKELLAKQ